MEWRTDMDAAKASDWVIVYTGMDVLPAFWDDRRWLLYGTPDRYALLNEETPVAWMLPPPPPKMK